ncbi:hypothetical protein CFE70_001377 [Pyrenophora teres f. teres 0-1]
MPQLLGRAAADKPACRAALRQPRPQHVWTGWPYSLSDRAARIYAKLQSFCQGLHGVTQFVVLLAAFRHCTLRLTGQDDATIGTVNANRDRWEIKDMIGFFVSMQCLASQLEMTLSSSWSSSKRSSVASHANADVPFESIVSKLKSDRRSVRHPLVQLVFAVHAQRPRTAEA